MRIDAFLRVPPGRPGPAAAKTKSVPPIVAPRPAALPQPQPAKEALAAAPAASWIEVYTDGACEGNGTPRARGGVGVAFPERPDLNVSEPLPPVGSKGPDGTQGLKHTNNRAELTAILRALQVVDERLDTGRTRPVRLRTDSMLCVNTFTKWLAGWKRVGGGPARVVGPRDVVVVKLVKRDGSPVLNTDLILAVEARLRLRRVEFVHVRAHTGRSDEASRFNALADELAVTSVT